MLRNKAEIQSNLSKLKDVLHEIGVIDKEFSGTIRIEINKGGISKLRICEDFK